MVILVVESIYLHFWQHLFQMKFNIIKRRKNTIFFYDRPYLKKISLIKIFIQYWDVYVYFMFLRTGIIDIIL